MYPRYLSMMILCKSLRYLSTTIYGPNVNEKGPRFEVDIEQNFRHFPTLKLVFATVWELLNTNKLLKF